jgi:UDP-N-acetylglucosamine 2-epimerase (non-hydrolysing)
MKIFLVVGARPNFIKIAPLLMEINKYLDYFTPLIVHTGQHYDYELSRVFFEDLDIPEPDFYLGIGSGTHAEQTGKIMIEFERLLFREKPNLVIVVGDVNSTIACALATIKIRCSPTPTFPLLAHVEAGLRSFDKRMPEEINRVVTDALSDLLFTTSDNDNENLKNEGIPEERIYLVGDIMVDSLLINKEKALNRSKVPKRLGLKDYALVTLHRPSNVDDRANLVKIMSALKEISKRIPIVYPMHPRTKKNIEKFGLLSFFNESNNLSSKIRGLHIIDPVGYLDFLSLEMNAKLVLTDSGGVQKETTVFGIPCLTLRETTEWLLTVTDGTNTVVGNNPEKILEEAFKVLDGKKRVAKIYKLWDGRTAERIVNVLIQKMHPS